ncbi:hypothetical protein QN277_014059 [Acacia crassicarpa]|uniref:Uncharacterized protein n=1 Tax=Acacia crassicarpa TaxID=499986 RepID=A0AAE1N501_9FABA|nr:hypothetical protein QN277_014059 [Acacia crassicarpa]
MAGGWSSTSAFRWFDFNFSVRSSLMRWTGMFASYILSPRWSPRRLMGWSNILRLSIVDDVLWGVITAFESVSIVSTLCFFFLFCGCTV